MFIVCLSCPSATFASQNDVFVPREWLAAKEPIDNFEINSEGSDLSPPFS